MSGDWLTYRELAVRLGVSVEAARRRALRARWAKQAGNDGKSRVLLPDDYEIDRRPDGAPDVRSDVAGEKPGQSAHLIAALEAHVETLKAQLAAAEARASASDARADAEAAKTAQAIAAFQSLAERLEAMAEAPPTMVATPGRLRHWAQRIEDQHDGRLVEWQAQTAAAEAAEAACATAFTLAARNGIEPTARSPLSRASPSGSKPWPRRRRPWWRRLVG
jgi:hypothetical protein